MLLSFIIYLSICMCSEGVPHRHYTVRRSWCLATIIASGSPPACVTCCPINSFGSSACMTAPATTHQLLYLRLCLHDGPTLSCLFATGKITHFPLPLQVLFLWNIFFGKSRVAGVKICLQADDYQI